MKNSIIILAWFTVMIPLHAQENWGVYDPKPGHPTSDEKFDFVEDVVPYAIEAEKKHGVPASVLVAMAIAESGYGWTRTALEANNYFGWKHFGGKSVVDRAFYELEEQPPEDKNNRYVVFEDRSDCFDFVAERLSTLERYQKAKKLYNDSSGSLEERTHRWIDAVADAGYNWKPEKYKSTLKRLLLDFRGKETSGAGRDFSLLVFSDPVFLNLYGGMLGQVDGIASLKRSQYMNTSDPKPAVFDGWNAEKFALNKHTYKQKDETGPHAGKTKNASVILLDPSPVKLSLWIYHACRVIEGEATKANTVTLYNVIRDSSGAHFVVSGMVYEDIIVRQPDGTEKINYEKGDGMKDLHLFRNGLSVRLKGRLDLKWSVEPFSESQADEILVLCAGELGPNEEGGGKWTGSGARIAGTWPSEFKEYHEQFLGRKSALPFDVKNKEHDWMMFVRDSYQGSWRSTRNALIEAKLFAK